MCNTFIYISNQETIFILEDTGFHYCEQKCGIHPQLWAGHRGKAVSGHSELAFPHGVVCGVKTWKQHSNPSAQSQSPCQARSDPPEEIRNMGPPSGFLSLGKNSIKKSCLEREPSFFPSFHALQPLDLQISRRKMLYFSEVEF